MKVMQLLKDIKAIVLSFFKLITSQLANISISKRTDKIICYMKSLFKRTIKLNEKLVKTSKLNLTIWMIQRIDNK